MKFGGGITRLRNSVETVLDWLDNGSPPWAFYRASMFSRLIALYKQPGVRPVGAGECSGVFFVKIVLNFTGI